MARISKGRKLKKTIYIFTEGETEKNYFTILNRKYNATSNVKVFPRSTGKQGITLLNYVEKKLSKLSKKELREIDEIYIIFDRDALSVVEVQNVMRVANSKNIQIGYSNSCFEIWLLAHFETPTIRHTGNRLYTSLEKHLGCTQYAKKHKNDIELLSKLQDNVSKAMKNTNFMSSFNQTQIQVQPYTNIGYIIGQIYKMDVY